jgi:beta-glucosidase
MVALNSLNGTPATSDSWLLKDVLRDQWGFKGITVSDHGAIKELIKHGTASDPEDAVRVALKSGINMSMSDEYYSKYLPGLVKSGKVTMAELDDATRHVLNVKYDMGLFNDPYSHLGRKIPTRQIPTLKAACTAKKRVTWRAKAWCC